MTNSYTIDKVHLKKILGIRIDNEMPMRCLHVEGKGQFRLLKKDEIKDYLEGKIKDDNDFLQNKAAAVHRRFPGISSENAMQRIAEDMCSYSILSHTWIGDTEVKFKDTELVDGKRVLPDRMRTGEAYRKLESFCNISFDIYKVEFAWADTICIDKEEPELGASIRSMFRWYSKATVCIAYLAQTTYPVTGDWDSVRLDKWFTRGWTLQELLAPQRMAFHDKSWTSLGTYSKDSPDVVSFLEQSHIGKSIWAATGISAADICGFRGGIGQTDVATRMRWISGRITTYEEDKVYSVMGIFGVEIAVTYGTGLHDAFFRLMQAIVSSDLNGNILSVFNFGGPSTPSHIHPTSLLPCDFTGYEPERSDLRMNYINDVVPENAFSFSVRGLSVNLLVVLARIVRSQNTERRAGRKFTLEIYQNNQSPVWSSLPIEVTVAEGTLPEERNIRSHNIYLLGVWSFRDKGAEVELPKTCSAFLFAHSIRTPCPEGTSVWHLPDDAISCTTKVDTEKVIVLQRRRYEANPGPEDQGSGHRRLVHADLKLLKSELPYYGMGYYKAHA